MIPKIIKTYVFIIRIFNGYLVFGIPKFVVLLDLFVKSAPGGLTAHERKVYFSRKQKR